MTGNLPPGCTPSDIDDAFGGPQPEECPDCGGVYTEDGHEPIEVNGNEEPCPNDGMDMHDLEQARRAHEAEAKMERRRLEEKLKDNE